MTDHSEANAAAVAKWTTYVQNDWARAEKVTRQTAFLILPHLRLDELMDPIKYPEPHFLEVGCGSGASAQLAFSELPPGVKQVCTDLTPAMLDAASQVLPEETTFVKTDAMDLTFKDHQFERYWSNYVIHLVPDPVAMAKEAFRVVKVPPAHTHTHTLSLSLSLSLPLSSPRSNAPCHGWVSSLYWRKCKARPVVIATYITIWCHIKAQA
eukprot:TRINITY_DN918_c0_g1_i19.p1 TRINITY_DN918_c0_g1~~TRINITY_DN918_c0_g1_i19.p1  ORF type:complete len:210 (+),score=29.73 TRINITY_DN918_c0_g1_i19:108-737(+)